MPLVLLLIAFVMPVLPLAAPNFCKAAIAKNITTCVTRLDTPTQRAMCAALIGGEDTTLCHSITDVETEQFCDAVNLRDDPACQALEEGNMRLVCHALISRNPAYCRDDGEPDAKAFCTALTSADASTCSTIENGDAQSFCRAYLKNDATLCPSPKRERLATASLRLRYPPIRGKRGWE